jgi:hypothetical protein
MTTLKDLLNDFAYKIAEIDTEGDDADSWTEQKDEIIDEYVEAICKRWVGQE